MLIFRKPCLGRVAPSPARRYGAGHTVSRYFQASVLWWFSLAVFCASSESQSSVSIHAAKNSSVTRDVCPTACVPALTSRAGESLSFVFLTLPATPGSHERSRAPCFSMARVRSGAPVFSLVSRTPKLSVSV